LAGFEEPEFIGRSIADLVPAADREKILARHQAVCAGQAVRQG
jgi:hypothetical protein